MTKRLFSLLRVKSQFAGRKQLGASMVESILVTPALLMLGAGILHLALLAQAKSNLEYAALMAARIGSSTPSFGFSAGGGNQMEAEVIARMTASDPRNATPLRCPSRLVRLCIVRPDDGAFNDHSLPNLTPGSDTIPNENLPYLSQDLGAQSGLSIQDANIFHLKVVYLFDSNVPFMNTHQSANTFYDNPHGVGQMGDVGNVERCRGVAGSAGTWISSDAVVTMQTPALRNNLMTAYLAVRDGNGGLVCPDFEGTPFHVVP